MINKIKTWSEIEEIVKRLRKENPNIKIVTTNGAFDILHIGHIRSLKEAKSYGDVLIVGLNSDSSIKAYKSPNRPIINQEERAEMLSFLEIVDYVVIFHELDPRKLLDVIKPDFHVKSKAGYKGIEKDVVEKNGGKIILTDTDIFSTSEIIERIIKNQKK